MKHKQLNDEQRYSIELILRTKVKKKGSKEVEEKNRIGDFESDLIIGKNHKGAFLTIIDRFSSFLLVRMFKEKKLKT